MSRLHLFQAYGIELEYMIVDRDTLKVRPITDELFHKVMGAYVSDVENGSVTWCNELVTHVLEMKCTVPTSDLVALHADFHDNVVHINGLLREFNAMLLPSAAHPFMDPQTETRLWPHDNNEVYDRYNQMFNCKGHGWSNLQSTHINFPFYDDEEFARLHAAIRLMLPLIPAIAASSPVLGGKATGQLDKRLDYYRKNQRVIPVITGKVIPERVFGKRQYHKVIYDKIAERIATFNEDGLLDPVWVNSRGAIARFDRGSIEIRLMDIQEAPRMDMAIVSLIISAVKMLADEHTCDYHTQQAWEAEDLLEILLPCIDRGEHAEITNSAYIHLFGGMTGKMTAGELWQHIINEICEYDDHLIAPFSDELNMLMNKGTLSTRILKALDKQYTPDNIRAVYRELGDCLAEDQMFIP